MAIAGVGGIGSGSSTSSGTTLVHTVANGLNVGQIGILIVGFDNTQTTDGQTSEISTVVDSAGNTWTKVLEFCNGNGGAGAGTVISMWMTKAAFNLAAAATITVTFANTITAKSSVGYRFSVAAGKVLALAVGGTATLANDAAAVGSLAISGLASLSRLYFRATASERNGLTFTATTNFTATNQAIANPAGGDTAITTSGEFRINTSTGETSAPTGSQSVDHASLMVALEEVDPVTFKSAWARGSNQVITAGRG